MKLRVASSWSEVTELISIARAAGKIGGGGSPPPSPPPGPPPSPPPAVTGFPNSTTVGYTNAPGYPGSLTAGPANVVSNTTYSYRSFPGLFAGSSGSPVSNVTFYGCRFKNTNVNEVLVALFGTNFKFQYCSFEPGAGTPGNVAFNQSYQYGLLAGGGYNTFANGLLVEYCDFWGFGNAIDFFGNATQALPWIFRYNYIHDASDDGGGTYHTDGIGMTNTGNPVSWCTVHNNTIDSPGNTNGLAFQQGTYSNITITNNLFSGFGFTVALWATSNNVVFTDNTYSTRLQPAWGPLYPQSFWTTNPGSWRRNKWLVPSGAEWGTPANSGKFWIPNTGMASSGDNQFVSTTDYTG